MESSGLDGLQFGGSQRRDPRHGWGSLRGANRARGRRRGRTAGVGQASCSALLVIFFVGEQCNQPLLENEKRSQPVLVALVSVDPVIRSGAVGRDERILVVAVVVEGVRVECPIVQENGVEGSLDGVGEIEIDDETPAVRSAWKAAGAWSS